MYQPPLQGYPLGYPDPQGYPAPQGRPQVPVKNPCSCCGTLTSAVKAIAITYIVIYSSIFKSFLLAWIIFFQLTKNGGLAAGVIRFCAN